jgi:hypothetical protein
MPRSSTDKGAVRFRSWHLHQRLSEICIAPQAIDQKRPLLRDQVQGG